VQVGDYVVCVDSSKLPHTCDELSVDIPNWVVEGDKYTIRSIQEHDFGAVGVLLEEVTNVPKYFRLIDKVIEPMFKSSRFRKLKPKEVEVLEEISAI
jgi:hypothetical protein